MNLLDVLVVLEIIGTTTVRCFSRYLYVNGTAARYQRSTGISLSFCGSCALLLGIPIQPTRALEIIGRKRAPVLTAKNTDLKVPHLALFVGCFCTSRFQILKSLEHQSVALDNVGHFLQRSAVGEEF